MTTVKLASIPIMPDQRKPYVLPYTFFSQLAPQAVQLEFRMHVQDLGTKKVYNVPVYRGTVRIVEPDASWLDWQLWVVYAVIAAAASGVAYAAYLTYLAPATPSTGVRNKKQK